MILNINLILKVLKIMTAFGATRSVCLSDTFDVLLINVQCRCEPNSMSISSSTSQLAAFAMENSQSEFLRMRSFVY
uniref:Uncharacterized protein n=1 Tax=Meloidogyne enterolobii TaxID=390850 RepID=A0A6V7X5I5_MELEN|nr:unnamed protein product [Meloidogyne enterolobii]